MKLIDTTFIIDVIRGRPEIQPLLEEEHQFVTTQINMYEVIVGLFYDGSSISKHLAVKEFFDTLPVLQLDDAAVIRSAEIRATMIKNGTEVDSCDCLIAGTALSKGVTTIITRNKKHFERIPGLTVESY